jgi:TPR repeat protein
LHADGLYGWGIVNYYGAGVQQDSAEAERMFRKAAKLGHTEAAMNLAYMLHHGLGASIDYSGAFAYYMQVVHKTGLVEAKLGAAKIIYEHKRYDIMPNALDKALEVRSTETLMPSCERSNRCSLA